MAQGRRPLSVTGAYDERIAKQNPQTDDEAYESRLDKFKQWPYCIKS